jgi:hypothetical protein
MTVGSIIFWLVIAFIVWAFLTRDSLDAGEQLERAAGDKALVCPHCHSTGTVSTETIRAKRGISGGKATGAILTGGLSMLVTGLSRKERVREAHCSHCGMVWHIS